MKGIVATTLLAALIAGSAAAAETETIRADAIVCEIEPPLVLLDQPQLRGQAGSVVMKRVAARIELDQLMQQAQGTLASSAAQEEAIRAAANLPGSTAVRSTQAGSAMQVAEAHLIVMTAFQRHCMATGAKALPVTVVERHPISGVTRVNMEIKGAPAEVWTMAAYLQQ